jgi:hypothetical protein
LWRVVTRLGEIPLRGRGGGREREKRGRILGEKRKREEGDEMEWANTVYTGWETEAISGGCCIKCIGTEIDRLVGLLAYCNEC